MIETTKRLALSRGIAAATLVLGIAASGWISATANAEDTVSTAPAGNLTADSPSVQRGLTVFKREAQCQFCHGWDGAGDDSEYGGNAPSLRATQLSRDEIAETVKCGRPGAGMPYHDKNAYTTDKCYGMSEADLAGNKVLKPIKFLSQRDIDAVADYVATVLKGKPEKPTLQDCLDFWGTGTRACDKYK